MAVVRLKKGRIKTLQARNPLVYSESIGKIKGSFSAGEMVEVQDFNGDFVGRGYINMKSDKAIRILSWDKNEKIDSAFLKARLQAAAGMRAAMGMDRFSNACRLVNSEGDGLPGLILDKYGDVYVMQIETAGMQKFEEDLVSSIWELWKPRAVVARPDLASMEIEGFQAREGLLKGECADGVVEISENGLRFFVDVLDGQGTGFFLNQRDNRLETAAFAKGKRILDCFTYTGAFAIYAGKKGEAEKVFGIESSASAMEVAGRNLEANATKNVVILQGEVFWELQNLVNRQELFDVVIVDPPRLITSWKTIEKGIQTYKVLNTLVLMTVRENGILVSCSSSEILEEEVFEALLAECAQESGRDLRIFAKRGPAIDHTKNPSCPRTRSLNCYFAYVI